MTAHHALSWATISDLKTFSPQATSELSNVKFQSSILQILNYTFSGGLIALR